MEEVYNPYEESLCTNEQLQKIALIMKRRAIGREFVSKLAESEYNKTTAHLLSKSEADGLIKMLQAIPVPTDSDDDQGEDPVQ